MPTMDSWVALASVISSGLVAIVGLWLTYRGGRDQRRHETTLAYEERAWDKKSAALYTVIESARRMVDILTSSARVRAYIGVEIFRVRDTLSEQVPMVESYASAECIEAFHSLRDLLRTQTRDYLAEAQVAAARKAKETALDEQDFDLAAKFMNQERVILNRAAEALNIDLGDLLNRSERLIVTARASVRGDTSTK